MRSPPRERWLESTMQTLFSITAKMIRHCRPIRLRPMCHCKRASSPSTFPASTDRNFPHSFICGRWNRPRKPCLAGSVMAMRPPRTIALRFLRTVAPLLLAAFCSNPCPAANAIYDALVGPGVKVPPQQTLQLPKPAMDDGLAPVQQRKVIESLLAGRYDWDTFTRKSVVSPFVLKISEGAAESGPIIRRVDLYLVAFGSFDSLKSEDYLTKQLNLAAGNEQSDTSGKAKLLTVEDMQKRNIAADKKPGDPRWMSVTSTLLGKVRISLTTQNIRTVSEDSILIASIADPRFVKDAEYPNSWQSLTVDDTGKRQTGPPEPYTGLGSYAKATKLAEPAGAIFMEYHVAFVEPQGWFHGTNLLRSKLPIVAQEMVRKFRRNLSE